MISSRLELASSALKLVLVSQLIRSAVVSLLVAAQTSEYAPTRNVQCPSTLLRDVTPQSQTINAQEQSYISGRETGPVKNAWSDWLQNGQELGYDINSFEGKYPRVGIAVGGGGYRAAQYGAGVLSALDARNDTARNHGTGGLLQVATYLSASSGGSWLAGSLILNDWPSIRDLVYGNGGNLSGWMLGMDLIAPDGITTGDNNNQAFYHNVLSDVQAKAKTGLDASATDLWGRMVAYHFLNGTSENNFYQNVAHGAGQLWSDIPHLSSYQNLTIPFPIIVADSQPIGTNITTTLPLDAIVYEITPYEFGSWDPNLSTMIPTQFAGTRLTSGLPTNRTSCVTGFDQASFVMGTSSSIFNELLTSSSDTISAFNSENGDQSGMSYLLQQFTANVQTRDRTVANWPNPFQNFTTPSTFTDAASEWLDLIDGGSNAERIPLGNLFVKARAVDVIVAIDASSDNTTNQWPNGTSPLRASQRISSLLSSSHQPFPSIPASALDFIATGVNIRPTFFGCDPTHNPPEYPLVIYLPNSPPLDGSAPATNTDAFQFSYSSLFTAVFINQAFTNTLGGFEPNTTQPDPNFGKCLQCAAIDRARYKVSSTPKRSDLCAQCFQQYCYNSSDPPNVSELPRRDYTFSDPDPDAYNKVVQFLKTHVGALVGLVIGVLAFIGAVIALIFWWRRRSERKARYSRVHELHEEDEPWKHYDASSGVYEMNKLVLDS
ncbi:phospholipase B [Hygrophoropsis aurantiaca]|uniref:Phospholipase B n=1 Tax=Hygrophoropsis aurantiaca TaxID=72124 RepID=A0ACB8ABG4_9AGAM|nr:phospholipase B [Hygrophoropsis aurantiaca]